MSTILRILKKPFFGRYQRPFRWPDGVDADEWTPHAFARPGGGRLAAVHARAHGPARGVAVLAHPMAVEAKAWGIAGGHAEILRTAGFDVFAFDLNGFGDSEDVDFDYPADVRAAGRYASTLLPDSPVVLVGFSMGAGHGLSSMDDDDAPFAAALLEGAFTTLEEFWRHFRVPYLVLRAVKPFFSAKAREMITPIQRAPRVRGLRRALFIYGARDRFTPPSMGERLIAALPLPADVMELWVVPDAKHIGALKTAPEAYRARMNAFLDAAVPRSG